MLIFIIGFIFITLFGSFSHFLYDLTNHNKIIGLFAAVNESTWEHVKMALTPFFLWSIFDYFFFGNNPNYFLGKLVGVLTIIILIPLIFYSYQIITKKNILFIDILTFILSIFFGQLFTYLILNSNPINGIISNISIIILVVIFISYLLLTLFPIKNFLFKDPLTNKYGFKGHRK